MTSKEKQEKEERGLTRDRLVKAALELIQEEGLEGLSMRALADRLEVKAASLYWHVRDRRELVELLAESILETVPATSGRSGWRDAVLEAGAALSEQISAQRTRIASCSRSLRPSNAARSLQS